VEQGMSRNAVARELQSVTGVVSQFFSMRDVEHSVARSRIQVYFSQRIAPACSTIAQCIIPPATFLAFFKARSLRTHARIYYFALKLSGYEAFSAFLGKKIVKVSENDCTV